VVEHFASLHTSPDLISKWNRDQSNGMCKLNECNIYGTMIFIAFLYRHTPASDATEFQPVLYSVSSSTPIANPTYELNHEKYLLGDEIISICQKD